MNLFISRYLYLFYVFGNVKSKFLILRRIVIDDMCKNVMDYVVDCFLNFYDIKEFVINICDFRNGGRLVNIDCR